MAQKQVVGHGEPKKATAVLFSVTSLNTDQRSKFFHRDNHDYKSHN